MSLEILMVPHNSKLYWQAVKVRELVLREPLGLSYTQEQLSAESEHIHFVALEGEKVLGTLQLQRLSSAQIKMRQVAVAFDQQGKGIGGLLIKEAEAYASRHGFLKIVLHARIVAKRFYDSQSYVEVGEIFQELGIDHVYMFKML